MFIQRLARILVVVVPLLSGCVDVDSLTVEPDVTSLPQYHGQSRQAMIDKLGPPRAETEMTPADIAGELGIEVFNTYPPDDPVALATPLLELGWSDGEYWTALWCHKVHGEWIVFESCRWHKDVVF